MLKTIVIIFILTTVGCSSNNAITDNISSDKNAVSAFPIMPLIIESKDEGWGSDIKLSFTASLINDTSTVYKVNSTYDNGNIGFEISVPKKGFAKLSFKSEGKISDNFLHLMQKLYKQQNDTSKFVDSIFVDCFTLADLNRKGEKDVVLAAQKKLFFQGEKDDDYAELYLNINEDEHWIELKEKDEEYRPIIIKLLTRH